MYELPSFDPFRAVSRQCILYQLLDMFKLRSAGSNATHEIEDVTKNSRMDVVIFTSQKFLLEDAGSTGCIT